jgi:beta-mannosidase
MKNIPRIIIACILLCETALAQDGNINIYTVSDVTADESATLEVRLMDFDGKFFWTKKIETKLKALSSAVALSIPEDEISKVGPDPGL